MVGKSGHEQSTYRAGGAPHHGCASFQRPNAGETSGGEPGDRQAGGVLEAEAVGNRH